jgi:long-chain acyl-CoA synthetase
MKGYWNKPEETAAVIDADGWFHTGDVGKFYKGNLKITDRIKNMIVNSFGKNVYPTPIENTYLKSAKIDQIFLIGDKQEYITAIIVPSKESLQEQFNLTESFFQEKEAFIKNAEMQAWVNEDVKKLSNELAKYERIKNFILKRNPFTIEDGEITPTLKTKRKVIETKFSSEIAAMYQDEEMPD